MDKVKSSHPMVSGKKVVEEIIILCTIRNFHYFLRQHKAKKLSRTLVSNQTTLLALSKQNLAKFGAGLKCLFSACSGNCGWCQQTSGIQSGHAGAKALESTNHFPGWRNKTEQTQVLTRKSTHQFSPKRITTSFWMNRVWHSSTWRCFKSTLKVSSSLCTSLSNGSTESDTPAGLWTLHCQCTEDAKPLRTFPLTSKAVRK